MAESKYLFDDPKEAFAEAEARIQHVASAGEKTLDLGRLGLNELPESIGQLTKIIRVDLTENKLRELPESCGQLNGLIELTLGYNRLSILPNSLAGLPNLLGLYLHANQLLEVPDVIPQLIHLRELTLSGNQLSKLPHTFNRLIGLQRLALDSNALTTISDALDTLVDLEELGLENNLLSELPESISQLRHLQSLDLRRNQLVSLPNSIGGLRRLRRLYLVGNRLKTLPESLSSVTGLESLHLHGNEALGLPPEVLGPTLHDLAGGKVRPAKPAAILDYFFRTRGGARPLNEAKLILLGRGEVGKTCVVNRLVHDEFKSTRMTKGIAITQWPVTSCKNTVRLHVWDFGGQEIQHATHQFFLTERSLYLVVLDGRMGAEEEDAELWLKFIKSFGGSSPTILVLNKIKEKPFKVNCRGLREKYPFIRAFVETDCKPKMKNGIPELKREIECALAAMEHVRANFPAGWFQIKERLAVMKKPFISFEEYRKLCAGLGENDAQAQERLAGFLNALGIALNFREDPQLREETVLNPHWITEGVYQIITSKTLAERQGELRLADLRACLKTKKTRGKSWILGDEFRRNWGCATLMT